jgi:hypothetical protein
MEINEVLSFAGGARRATEPECVGLAAVLKNLSQSACNRSATGVVSKSNHICNRNSAT